jgi:hypothetical protein
MRSANYGTESHIYIFTAKCTEVLKEQSPIKYNILQIAWLLRHYNTSQKVAGLRSNEVNEFFKLPNPPGHTRPGGSLSL